MTLQCSGCNHHDRFGIRGAKDPGHSSSHRFCPVHGECTVRFHVKLLLNRCLPVLCSSQGLNAAALGLVCLAAHQLSGKVVTDPATRLLVFFSGAIASCYESQWLYPVLMVAGGLTTFTVDFAQQRRDKARRAQAAPGAVTGSSDPTAEGVNVALQVPAPAARANSTATTAESTTRLLRRTTTGESRTSQRYPTPPLDDSNGGSFVAAHEDSEAQPQQEPVYFSLSIRGGCCM